MLKKLILVSVVLIVTGCGKNSHSSRHWPAVVTFAGFSDTQKEELLTALSEMNGHVRRTLVAPESLDGAAYPITVTLRSPWEEAPTRAGYAIVEEEKCSVELSTVLYDSPKKEYLKPVVWHELGHCAGMGHDTTEGEVMYRTSSPFSTYASDAFDRFFSAISQATGI